MKEDFFNITKKNPKFGLIRMIWYECSWDFQKRLWCMESHIIGEVCEQIGSNVITKTIVTPSNNNVTVYTWSLGQQLLKIN